MTTLNLFSLLVDTTTSHVTSERAKNLLLILPMRRQTKRCSRAIRSNYPYVPWPSSVHKLPSSLANEDTHVDHTFFYEQTLQQRKGTTQSERQLYEQHAKFHVLLTARLNLNRPVDKPEVVTYKHKRCGGLNAYEEQRRLAGNAIEHGRSAACVSMHDRVEQMEAIHFVHDSEALVKIWRQ